MSNVPFFEIEKIADRTYKIKNAFTGGFDTLCYLAEGETYAPRFDMMYGGHEIFDSSIIDEGIETAAKVIAGTDDKVKTTGMTGKDICYAYKKNDDGSNEGGHRFNMSYDPERIVGDDVFGQK